MKKLLLTILFLNLSWNVYADKLGMSNQQLALWQKMKTEKHKFYQDAVKWVQTDKVYEDLGLRDGLMYLLTGDGKWAQSAFRHIAYYRGRDFWRLDKTTPTRNQTRHEFITMAILYDWIKDGLSDKDRQGFKDILNYWADLVIGEIDSNKHFTRLSDSDETTGHYFGLVLFALSIENEDPKRSQALLHYAGNKTVKPVGGLVSTYPKSSGYGTWRNAVAMFCTKAKGGEWIEGSQYNTGTIQYLVIGVSAINNHFKKDMFLECTDVIQNAAKVFVNQMTPNMKDSFQWGDTEGPRNLGLFRRVSTMALLGGITKNPEALWLFDKLYNKNGTANIAPHWILLADPYSPRKAPSGISSHLADGMGVAYYHTGWTSDDSFFSGIIKPFTGVDHETDMFTNFNLYRKGGWAITNPRGYYGHPDNEAPYQNTLLVNGALPLVTQEIKKIDRNIVGDNFVVQSGVAGGQSYTKSSVKPPVTLNAWRRTHVYKHNSDGSDMIMTIDDIDAVNPLTLSSSDLDKFDKFDKKRIKKADGRHQWLIHMPNPPVINGRDISWTAENGETVYLRTNIRDFEAKLIDLKETDFGGYFEKNDKERKFQLRIIPKSTQQKQRMINLIKVGSPIVEEDFKETMGLVDVK